jgi:hypothetical protein
MPKEVVRYANEFVVRDGRVVYNPDSRGPDEVVKHSGPPPRLISCAADSACGRLV